jgi:hypothetical protein
MKLSALFLCRPFNLQGLELENPTAMLAFHFTRKRGWGFYQVAGWMPWFHDKPDQECRP